MSAFVLAILSMALKDSVNTILVIAEARGRASLAAVLAAASDFAGLLVTLAGAGVIISDGWTVRTVGILGSMMVSSYLGTFVWVRIGRRISRDGEQGMQADTAAAQVPELSRRLAALEQKLSPSKPQ